MAKITLSSPSSRYKASVIAVWAAMIAVYIAWGSTYLAIRFAVETMPPFLMAAARFLTAGSLLFIYSRLKGAPLPRWNEARFLTSHLISTGSRMFNQIAKLQPFRAIIVYKGNKQNKGRSR